jgi:ethanolamine utilization protein EutN
MQVALVIGHTHSTVKHPTLQSNKLLIVQPLMADNHQPDGSPMLTIDRTGAGAGDRVILTSDGRAIREVFGLENSPIRWAVLGIVDETVGA